MKGFQGGESLLEMEMTNNKRAAYTELASCILQPQVRSIRLGARFHL